MVFSFTFKKVTSVPWIIEHYHALTEFNMCYNNLTEIPKGLAKLPNLQKIILAENKISE